MPMEAFLQKCTDTLELCLVGGSRGSENYLFCTCEKETKRLLQRWACEYQKQTKKLRKIKRWYTEANSKNHPRHFLTKESYWDITSERRLLFLSFFLFFFFFWEQANYSQTGSRWTGHSTVCDTIINGWKIANQVGGASVLRVKFEIYNWHPESPWIFLHPQRRQEVSAQTAAA